MSTHLPVIEGTGNNGAQWKIPQGNNYRQTKNILQENMPGCRENFMEKFSEDIALK